MNELEKARTDLLFKCWELSRRESRRRRRLAFGWVAVLAALNVAVIVLRLWMHRMDTEDLWSPRPEGWPSEQREPRQESAPLGGVPLPQAWSPERVP